MLSAGLGTIIWTSAAFITVLLLLSKFAWKPILNGLKERETNIENALKQADQAREEMARLSNENAKLLEQARTERDKILAEAREMRERIISDAKSDADVQAKRLVEDARLAIQNEKQLAMNEVKNLVASLSIDIAEKVLREKFADRAVQEQYVGKQLEEIKLN